jgi:rhamnosyltransferase
MKKGDLFRSLMDEISPPDKSSVCGIIVTFNPDEKLHMRIDALLQQVAEVVIIDNGSTMESIHMLKAVSHDNLEIHFNERNEGIASALNSGILRSKALGFNWALTVDDDSWPKPGMVESLCKTYRSMKNQAQIAIIAPNLHDPNIDKWAPFLRPRFGFFYKRTYCVDENLEDVTTVISSGTLLSIPIWGRIGGFREDFFIDYVDTEYCLRALSNGYKIVVACSARLDHRLGDRRKTQLGPFIIYPTFHSPDRWYYLGRNRIPMFRAYGHLFPHWLLYDFIAGLYGLSRMLLFEDAKREKLSAFLRGICHGLQGRMGKMS